MARVPTPDGPHNGRVTRRSPRFLVVAAGLAAALALAACVDDPGTDPTAAPDPTTSPGESASPSGSPSAPTGDDVALDLSCDDLLGAEAVYDFNPTFADIGAWDPDAGTVAADSRASGGVACRWVGESSGATLDVSAARFAADRIAAAKADADAAGDPVDGGDEAYFWVADDGRGTLVVFDGDARVAIESGYLVEPADVRPLVDEALAALAAA